MSLGSWRHARPACASLALATAMLATPAQAQDNDGYFWLDRLNQIVVTATRAPVKIQDVPVSITVKTDEQIADERGRHVRLSGPSRTSLDDGGRQRPISTSG